MKSGRLNQTKWLLLVLLALAVSGCSHLKINEKKGKGIVLPKSQMEHDSVAVRVAVAELDDHQKKEFESFFATTDQKLPLEIRRRLDDNGIRVSVVSGVNTSQLQTLLAPSMIDRKWLSDRELELADAGKLEPVFRLASQRHVEKKRGESFSVEVSPVRPESTWRIHVGKQQLPGRARLAQCQIRVTSWAQPDGKIRLSFLPEIHHGQNLSHIGVNGSDFAVQQRREIEELHSLAFELTVNQDETVIVAATKELERIGNLFFNASTTAAPGSVAAEESVIDDSAAELFPMIKNENETMDASVLVEGSQLEDTVIDSVPGRPQPWQRFLLLRVVDVTPPALR